VTCHHGQKIECITLWRVILKKLLSFIAAFLLFSLSGAALAAQPADEQPVLNCDTTLITLLLIAINDYGYQPPLPLDRYALGPYSDERVSTSPEAPTVRQQAEARVAEAARSVEEGGFPGIAREIEGLSKEIGTLAEAGESLLEAGQAAIEAGRAAFEGEDEPAEMPLGALPGEAEACTQLRDDLVRFFFARLTAAETE
jgi:hypothetical protein